jgi:hypothetical protein
VIPILKRGETTPTPAVLDAKGDLKYSDDLLSSERHAILVEESLIIVGWAALWTLASRVSRSEETDWDLVRSGSRAANSRNRPLRTNVLY